MTDEHNIDVDISICIAQPNLIFILFSGKLKPRAKRRVSSESPQKTKTSPLEKKSERRRKASLKSPPPPAQKETNSSSPQSLSEETPDQSSAAKSAEAKQSRVEEVAEDLDATIAETDPVSDTEVKSPLPIRLPTKCKPKTDSDSDSDSKSTKSSASSSGRVSKVLKKTFKGKAIAIVKPFSNAVTEKKSPTNEKQKEIEARLNLYDFGSDEERDAAGQRNKLEKSDQKGSSEKDSPEVTSDLTSLNNTSSSISSIKGIKRIKSVKQGLLSSRRLRVNPELKSVRVRVEKLQNNSSKSDKLKVRQSLAKNKTSSAKARLKEKQSSSTESSSSCDPSESNTPDKSQESESESSSNADVENREFLGSENTVPECKEELGAESLIHSNQASQRDLDKLGFPPSQSSPECKPSAVKVEPVQSEILPVPYNSKALLLKDEKIAEIVKSEIFSQPSSLSQDSVKPKPEKSVPERNEESRVQANR